MSFRETVDQHFPGSIPQEVFVRRAAVTLIQDHDFSPTNSLACAGVCRDELCRSLTDEIGAMWGDLFDFSSLAGMLTLGRTGFAAARAHAPVENGRARYLFLLFTHIGIGPRGEQGVVERPGRPGLTRACGALASVVEGFRHRQRRHRLDWRDPELSLLRMRLAQEEGLSESPDLIELTKAVHRATVGDLHTLMAEEFDRQTEDFAVVAGVQIHGPGGISLLWPGTTYVVVEGRRSEIWF
jgi:hypothetical protein